MKRDECVIRLAFAFTFALTSLYINGQTKNGNGNSQGKEPDNFSYNVMGEQFTSNVPINEISSVAFRHFKRKFPAVANESWIKTGKGYSVSFTEPDSSINHVYYDSEGGFVEQITYYIGKNIPENVRDLTDHLYHGYTATIATKLQNNASIVYGATLTNGNATRLIEFHNGQVDTLNEFEQQPAK